MSQQVNKTKTAAELNEIWLRSILEELRNISRFFGNVLAFLGWCVFLYGVMFLLFDSVRGSFPDPVPFNFAAYFITPGWLLLRFAAGLFPFSSKLVKTGERPVS